MYTTSYGSVVLAQEQVQCCGTLPMQYLHAYVVHTVAMSYYLSYCM